MKTSPDTNRALEVIMTLASEPGKVLVFQELCSAVGLKLDDLVRDTSPKLLKRLQEARDIVTAVEAQPRKTGQVNLRTDIDGSKLLNINVHPQIKELVDLYFNRVHVNLAGSISWQLKEGVIANEVIIAIDTLNRTLHGGQTLLPNESIAMLANSYNSPDGARSGAAMFALHETKDKDYYGMSNYLNTIGLQLSTRYNSIVSLNVYLLLTGATPFTVIPTKPKGYYERRGFRDAAGELRAPNNSSKGLCHYDGYSATDLALASPIVS